MRYTGKMFIKNKSLYVELTSAVVKNELLMCRERLIQNLNKASGKDDLINNIIFI
jgi:hypothetical protein